MDYPMDCIEANQIKLIDANVVNFRNIFEVNLRTCLDENAFNKLQGLMLSHPNYHAALKRFHKKFECSISIPEGVGLAPIKQLLTYKALSYAFQLVSSLARYPYDENIFMEIFEIFFYHALTGKNKLSKLSVNFALIELENLAKSRQISLERFYKLNSRRIINCLTEAIIHLIDEGQYNINVQSSIVVALEVFNQDSISLGVIAKSLSYVTELVGRDKYIDTARIFIRNLAISLDMKTVKLIDKHIQSILIDLLVDKRLQTDDQVKKALYFLAEISGEKLDVLLSPTKSQFIKGRILLHYYNDNEASKKTVIDSIYFVDTLFPFDDGPMLEELEDERHFIEYLRPSFISILMGIDSHFLSVENGLGNLETIKQIESLSYIIGLFDPTEIEVLHVKLMSTLSLLIKLRPCRNLTKLNEVICNSWYNFVKCMPIRVLSSLMINICVTLYDLIDDCPQQVSKIYRLIIRPENAKLLRLKSLFFIPEVPELKDIYTFLTQFIKRDVHLNSEGELEDLIETVIPLVRHENQRCRLLAMSRLLEIIKKNMTLFHKIISKHRDEPVDKLISRIIETLMTVSSYQDKETSSLIAQCLGAIGAIDPIRLDHLIFGDTPGQPSILYISSSLEEEVFISELIERLKNSLFSDRKDESEAASFALQVLVKKFELYNSRNQFKLNNLSSEAIRACDLCKNTDFDLTISNQNFFNSTIFEKLKSDHIYSYKVWLHRFTLYLTNSFNDYYVKIRETLCACSYVSKYNHLLAQFLLPYIIVHIVLNERDKMNILLDEMNTIIEEDTGLSTQDMETATSEEGGTLQSLHFQCANMLFSTMDFIFQMYANRMTRKMQSDPMTAQLAIFLSRVPLEKLALLAYRCKSHARALCYFEQFLYAKEDSYDKYATIMQRIYVALDDTDEARGIDMRRTRSPTVLDDISEHEASGHYDRAFINCTIAMQSSSEQHNYQKDALRCLALQGDFERLNAISKDYLQKYPVLKRDLTPYFIESSWKLNKWGELNSIVRSENIEPMLDSIGVGLGVLIDSVISNKPVEDMLSLVRDRQMKPLSLAMIDRSAYFRGYQSLVSFHMINDFESCVDLMLVSQQSNSNMQLSVNSANQCIDNLFAKWKIRNSLVQPSLKSLEPILTLQRSLADMMKNRYMAISRDIKLNIGKLWLNSAKLSREARSYERAHMCITQAQRCLTDAGFDRLKLSQKTHMLLEKTKLHWDRNDKTLAIRGLKLELDRLRGHPLTCHLRNRVTQRATAHGPVFPKLGEAVHCGDCNHIHQDDKKAFAQIKLLLTYYCEESAAAMPGALFDMYEELVHLAVDQEETYFRLARYYDRLLTYYIEHPHLVGDQNQSKLDTYENVGRLSQSFVGEKEDVYTNLMVQSIYAFGNSLLFGVRYLRESMPRLLNIWYDLGSKKGNNDQPTIRSTSSRIEESIRFVNMLQDKLPPYYFMTALSLILSRICHPHSGVSRKTSGIIFNLLQVYPHQITWRLISVINDKENSDRARAASSVIKQVKSTKQRKIIDDILAVSNVLVSVCSKTLQKNFKPGSYPVNIFVASFEQTFSNKKIQVMFPSQAAMTAVIPLDNDEARKKEDNFEPYPSCNQTFILKFKPMLDVLSSMQKPRKLTLTCTDGSERSLLCKPTDDLRKDSRCMEFFDLINKLLKRDATSNARFFEIQTFLVLPLTSVSGILEWVPNLLPLRNPIDNLYKERNPKFDMRDIYGKRTKDPPNEAKPKLYVDEVLPRVKPGTLPLWFLRNFCEPTSWYMARLAFTRTTAVISMAGYIIGLGDRHLDNILVDTITGRTVHVDFNLLFHQGEGLPVSERVPFRLTHNLISTFGALGYEGNFRSTSEITLRVMRKEKDALLTTLKPFIHDPCSDWTRTVDHHGEKRRSEMENLTAKEKIIDTERKLKGYPRSKFKPLSLIDSYSVEAQVDHLIEEAIDPHSLSLMYHGWCPHI